VKWEVVWTRPAIRDLRRLDRQIAERARAAVRRLAETGQGDVRRLQEVDPPEWALRIGDWRVRFAYDFPARTISVLRVLPRGRAYRD
jgi:mRNA interferase RelE/StbE